MATYRAKLIPEDPDAFNCLILKVVSFYTGKETNSVNAHPRHVTESNCRWPVRTVLSQNESEVKYFVTGIRIII